MQFCKVEAKTVTLASVFKGVCVTEQCSPVVKWCFYDYKTSTECFYALTVRLAIVVCTHYAEMWFLQTTCMGNKGGVLTRS